MHMHAYECCYPQRPEEAIGSPGVGVTGNCEQYSVCAGTEFKSSRVVINCQVISPALHKKLLS